MAVIGHWNTLAEAQKLTQSQLIGGVVEEDVKRENPIDRIPVALAQGKSIKWNREEVTLEDNVAGADIGDQLSWTSNVTYSLQETELKRKYIQRILDSFIVDVYGTVNNYEAQALWEMKKGMVRRLGDDLIYDDITYGGDKQYDGLHALAALQTGTNLDIDNGEVGLSLTYLRTQIDEMKHGVDVIYMPYCIARRMDAAYQERGFAGTAGDHNLASISYGMNEMGKRIMFFDGIPIVRTDYLVAENANTGEGSDIRAKHSTGTANYSIFLVKWGRIFDGNPGLCLGFGDPEMGSELYKTEYFEKLEDYDAAGIRLVTYTAPLLGSKLSLGRIFDITDVAITI